MEEIENESCSLFSWVGGSVGGWCRDFKIKTNLSQVRLTSRLSLVIEDEVAIFTTFTGGWSCSHIYGCAAATYMVVLQPHIWVLQPHILFE